MGPQGTDRVDGFWGALGGREFMKKITEAGKKNLRCLMRNPKFLPKSCFSPLNCQMSDMLFCVFCTLASKVVTLPFHLTVRTYQAFQSSM